MLVSSLSFTPHTRTHTPHTALTQVNLQMLRSVVEAAEALAPSSLHHVFCMSGGKWYGQVRRWAAAMG